MTEPLWQKSGVAIDARVMRFLAGDDVCSIANSSVTTSPRARAHVEGLARIGLLTADEETALKRELSTLDDLFAQRRVRARRTLRGRPFRHRGFPDRTSRRRRPQGAHRPQPQRSGPRRDASVAEGKTGDARGSVQTHRAASVSIAPSRDALPMPGYTHLQRAVAVEHGDVVRGLRRSVHRRCDPRRRHVALDRRQSARHRRRLRREPASSIAITPRRRSASRACRSRRSTRSCRAASSRWPRSKRCAARCSICAGWPGI